MLARVTIGGISILIATLGGSVAFPQEDPDSRLDTVESRIEELANQQTLALQERNDLLQTSLTQREELLDRSISQTGDLLDKVGTFATYAGVLATIISAIFIWVTASATSRQAQYLREQTNRLDSQRNVDNMRQDGLANSSIAGATQVAAVLGVVEKMLLSRLLASEREGEQIEGLQTKIDSLTQQVSSLTQGVISERGGLAREAAEIAAVPRHEFKKRQNLSRLAQFSTRFDGFVARQADGGNLDAKMLYVRGVAAHFENNLSKIQAFLNGALRAEALAGEDERSAQKRKANAHYFLGLLRSNMGDAEGAVLDFEQTMSASGKRDFLTRIAAADSLYMSGDYVNAAERLEEIEKGIEARAHEEARGPDANDVRMLSRASLIRANMAILRRHDRWVEVAISNAKQATEYAPDSYYAHLTLGQLLSEKSAIDSAVNPLESTEAFKRSFELILESNHVDFVNETRSRLTLLMAAAMSCKRGDCDDSRKFDSYLDEASQLVAELPRLNGEQCTVFSLLSKTNVSADTIAHQLVRFRDEDWLLQPKN